MQTSISARYVARPAGVTWRTVRRTIRLSAGAIVIGISLSPVSTGAFAQTVAAVILDRADPEALILEVPDTSTINTTTNKPEIKLELLNQSDIVTYKSAFKFAKKKNWKAARRQAAQAHHPLPRKILAWLEMTKSGGGYSFHEINEFVNQNPDWPLPNTIRNRAEEAITDTTSHDAILNWFANRPPKTTDGKIAFTKALIAAGRREEGNIHLRDAWIYGRFNRKNEARFIRKYHSLFTQADHWERLDNLLWNGRHRQARRMLRHVSTAHRALANARIRLRRRRGGVDGAISKVPDWLRRDPGFLYERMRWRRRKGRDLEALEILKSPPGNLVRPELWSKERIILARRLLADGKFGDAYQAIQAHGLDYRHKAELAEAEWLTGWIALRFLNQATDAKQRFENLFKVVNYPVSKARAAYWTGRASKALGDVTQAADWFQIASGYPTTYHGQLATQELGKQILPSPEPVTATDAERTQFESHELTHAVRLLHQLGQRKHIRTFLFRHSKLKNSLGQKIMAGELANSIGRLDLAVWIARHAHLRGSTLPNMGYPLFQMPDGTPERALLLAVARQESNFYPQAISRSGARGIMQLMPRTARLVARSNGLRYSRTRLTSDPVYNVSLGRRYLGQMLAKFSGSYILAIAAYNAGPNAVSRWLRKNGDPRNGIDDPIDWIELIPFQETRTYVQRVFGNLQVFRNRLQPGRMAVTLDQDLRR